MVSARKNRPARRQEGNSSGVSVQVEIFIDFDRPVTNRLAIFHRWTEASLLDRLGCLFIQALSQLADHPDVAGRTIGLDNDAENKATLEPGPARFLRELWVDLGNDFRIADSFTSVINPSAGVGAAGAGNASRLSSRSGSFAWGAEGERAKLTCISVSTSTGSLFSRYGLYSHCLTASMAACTSIGCPLTRVNSSIEPSLLITALKTTVPWMRAWRAIGG
jgi:hypothetical protein